MRNDCTGAMIAHGPPLYCTNADGSSLLNTKPESKRSRDCLRLQYHYHYHYTALSAQTRMS